MTHLTKPGAPAVGHRLRRLFSTVEMAIALGVLVVVSLGVAMVMANALGQTSRAMSEQGADRALARALDHAQAQGFDAILAGTVADDLCNEDDEIDPEGEIPCSTILVSGVEYLVIYEIAEDSDLTNLGSFVASSGEAAGVQVTVRTVTSQGRQVERSRWIAYPFAGFGGGYGALRVSVGSESGEGLPSTDLFLVTSDGTEVARAEIEGGASESTVLFLAPGDACSTADPCHIGLADGPEWWRTELGGGAEWGVVGAASQSGVTVTAGALAEASVRVTRGGEITIHLLAGDPDVRLTPAPGAVTGSICLWATFVDEGTQRSVPLCNFSTASEVSLSEFNPGGDGAGPKYLIPSGVPVTLSVDHPDGTCPTVPGLKGHTLNDGWDERAVCSSWTWGYPTLFGDPGDELAEFGGSVVLEIEGGAELEKHLVWQKNDDGRPAAGYESEGEWLRPREAPGCALDGTCQAIGMGNAPEPKECPGQHCFSIASQAPEICVEGSCPGDPDSAIFKVGNQSQIGLAGEAGVPRVIEVEVRDADGDLVSLEVTELPEDGELRYQDQPVQAGVPIYVSQPAGQVIQLVYHSASNHSGTQEMILVARDHSGQRLQSESLQVNVVLTSGVTTIIGEDVAAVQGATGVELVATLLDGFGDPVEGETALFVSPIEGIALQSSTDLSDAAGQASVLADIVGAPAGEYQVIVSAGGATGAVKVTVISVVAGIDVVDQTVVQGGSENVTFIAVDAGGNPAPGVVIDFEGVDGPQLSRPSVAHDQDGNEVAENQGRYYSSLFHKGIALAQATANLVSNPMLAETTSVSPGWDESLNGTVAGSGWSTGYLGWVASPEVGFHAHVVEGAGPTGEHAWFFSDTNSTFDLAHRPMEAAVKLADDAGADLGWADGTSVTVSLDVKTDHPEKFLRVGLRHTEADGVSVGYGSAFADLRPAVVDQWGRASATFVLDGDEWDFSKEVWLVVEGHHSDEGAEARAWATKVMVETAPGHRGFAVGSRAAEILALPGIGVVDPEEGTIEFMFSPVGTPGSLGTLFSYGGAGNELQVLWGTSAGLDTVTFRMAEAGGSTSDEVSVVLPDDLVVGEWYWVVARWNLPGTMVLTVHDVGADQTYTGSAEGPAGLPDFSSHGTAYLGGTGAVSAWTNSVFDELRISEVFRSGGEVTGRFADALPPTSDAATTLLHHFDGAELSTGGISVGGSCATAGDGTCQVLVNAGHTQQSGAYRLRISSGSFGGFGALTIAQRADQIEAPERVYVSQGGTAEVSVRSVDGAGMPLVGAGLSFTESSIRFSMIEDPGDTGEAIAITDRSGVATVTVSVPSDAAPGTGVLTVSQGAVTAPVAIEVLAAPGSLDAPDVILEPGETLFYEVSVFDGSGLPLAGAEVFVVSGSEHLAVGIADDSPYESSALTGEDGKAVLILRAGPSAPPGNYTEVLEVTVGGLAPQLVDVQVPQRVFEIVVDDEAYMVAQGESIFVTGTAYDNVGDPVNGPALDPEEAGNLFANSGGDGITVIPVVVPIGADGRFSFEVEVQPTQVAGPALMQLEGTRAELFVDLVVTSVVDSISPELTPVIIEEPLTGTVGFLVTDLAGTGQSGLRVEMTTEDPEIELRPALLGDPLAWWRMGEGGGAGAVDSSGNERAGVYGGAVTLNAGGLLNSDPDTAAGFGLGANLLSNIDVASELGESFTVAGWVRASDFEDGLYLVGGSEVEGERFYLRTDSAGEVFVGIGGYEAQTGVILATGTTYHIAWVVVDDPFDAGLDISALYLDGEGAWAAVAGEISEGRPTAMVSIGDAGGESVAVFDEWAVWATALEGTAINAQYLTGVEGSPSHTVAITDGSGAARTQVLPVGGVGEYQVEGDAGLAEPAVVDVEIIPDGGLGALRILPQNRLTNPGFEEGSTNGWGGLGGIITDPTYLGGFAGWRTLNSDPDLEVIAAEKIPVNPGDMLSVAGRLLAQASAGNVGYLPEDPDMFPVAGFHTGSSNWSEPHAGTIAVQGIGAVAPVIEDVATYQRETTSGQTHSVTLPSGIQPGDLLVAVLRFPGSGTITDPAWWSEAALEADLGSTAVLYAEATGSEGATVDITLSSQSRMAAVVYRISGWGGGIEAATINQDHVTDPPPVAAEWADDTLWIAALTNHTLSSYPSTVTGTPSSYSDLVTIGNTPGAGTNSTVRVSTAHRRAARVPGFYTDPDPFATSGTINQPHSATIAVRGSSGDAPVVEEVSSYAWDGGSGTTSHAVTLPSGTQNGDLLLMVLRPGSTSTATLPGGWNEVASQNDGGRTYIWYREADGTEGATQSVTTGSTWMSAVVYRISGWQGTPDAKFAAASVNDGPLATLAGSDDGGLFLAVLTNRRSDSNVTAAPSGFDDLVTVANPSNTATSRARVSVATKSEDVQIGDPGETWANIRVSILDENEDPLGGGTYLVRSVAGDDAATYENGSYDRDSTAIIGDAYDWAYYGLEATEGVPAGGAYAVFEVFTEDTVALDLVVDQARLFIMNEPHLEMIAGGEVEIEVELLDSENIGVEGADISLSTTSPDAVFGSATIATGERGMATTTLSVPAVANKGLYEVTATEVGGSKSDTATLSITGVEYGGLAVKYFELDGDRVNLGQQSGVNATATSTLDGSSPEGALDGVYGANSVLANEWIYDGTGPQSLTVDLGGISGVSSIWLYPSSLAAPTHGQVEISDDGVGWTRSWDFDADDFTAVGAGEALVIDVEETARYVRVTLNTGNTGTNPQGVGEIKILSGDGHVNLARNPLASASASSEYSTSYLAANAIDGQKPGSTTYHWYREWATQGGTGAGNYLSIDMGRDAWVHSVTVYDRPGSDDFGELVIKARAANNETWRDVVLGEAPPADGTGTTYVLPNPVQARHLRVESLGVGDAGTNIGLAEVEVWGTFAMPEPGDGTIFRRGVLANLDLSGTGNVFGSGRSQNVAMEAEGLLEITEAGTYTFYVEGMDDAVLKIDGEEVVSYSLAHGVGWSKAIAGDYTGDGVDDLAVLDGARGDIWVQRGGPQGLGEMKLWAAGAVDVSAGEIVFFAGDFNGDGETDLGWAHLEGLAAGEVWVAVSEGDTFSSAQIWGTLGENAVRLDGHSGTYGEAGDDATLELGDTGEIEVRVRGDWDAPHRSQVLVAKSDPSTDDRSWALYHHHDGTLRLAVSEDGVTEAEYTSIRKVSAVAESGHLITVGVKFDLAADEAEFFAEGVSLGGLRMGALLENGLSVQYDASAITGLSDGAAVASWTDGSGNGHTLGQAAAGNRPSYRQSVLNGKPAVRFDGNDRLWTSTTQTDSLDLRDQLSIFMVARVDRWLSTTSHIVIKNTDLGSDDQLQFGLSRQPLGTGGAGGGSKLYSGGTNTDSGTDIIVGRPVLIEALWDGETISFYHDGVFQSSTPASGSAAFRQYLSIGGRSNQSDGSGPGQYNFAGDIGEVLIFDRGLGDVERRIVEEYLLSKWEITPWTLGDSVAAHYDAASTTAATGSAVGAFPDLSGNGHTLSQGTSASRPTLQHNAMNGRPVVRFDGTDDRLGAVTVAGDSLDLREEHSFFAVLRPQSTANSHLLFKNTSLGTEGDVQFGLSHQGSNTRLYIEGSNFFNSGTPFTPGSSLLLSSVWDGQTASIFHDGVLQNSGALTGTPTFKPNFSMGARNSDANNPTNGPGLYNFSGDIGEVLIFNRALSDVERAEVEAYLSSKWGLLSGGLSSSLAAHFDASSITAASGSAVTTWNDLSGNANHVSQGTSGNRPTVQYDAMNGRPVVRFDGDDRLGRGTTAGDSLDLTSEMTAFAVAKPTTVSGQFHYLISKNNTGGFANQQYSLSFGTENGLVSVIGGTATPNSLGRPIVNQPTILSAWWNGSTVRTFENGELVGQASAGSNSFMPNFGIGSRSNTSGGIPGPGQYNFSGDIGEVLIFNRALSDVERAEVEAYLSAKWMGATAGEGELGLVTATFDGNAPVTIGVLGDGTGALLGDVTDVRIWGDTGRTDLRAEWSMTTAAENATSVSDSSVNNNTLTLSGTAVKKTFWATQHGNSVLDLTKSSAENADFGVVADSSSLDVPRGLGIEVVAAANWASENNSYRTLVSKWNTGSENAYHFEIRNDDTLQFWVGTSGGNVNYLSTETLGSMGLEDGDRAVIAVSFDPEDDNSRVTFWVNGEQLGETVSGPMFSSGRIINDSSRDVIVGGRTDGNNTRPLRGTVERVRISDGLDSDGRLGDELAGAWNFAEAEIGGASVTDSSGNGNDLSFGAIGANQIALPSPATLIAAQNATGQHHLLVGEVDGDGDDDLVWVDAAVGGRAHVLGGASGGFSDGGAAETRARGTHTFFLGDSTGDGKHEIYLWDPLRAEWRIVANSGGAFSDVATGAFRAEGPISELIPFVGNFYDIEAVDEVATYNPQDGKWHVRVPNGGGTSFGSAVQYASHTTSVSGEENYFVGDFNNDGLSDLAYYNPATRAWGVGVVGFGSITFSNWGNGAHPASLTALGDFVGNNRTNVAYLAEVPNNQWRGLVSSGALFGAETVWVEENPQTVSTWACAPETVNGSETASCHTIELSAGQVPIWAWARSAGLEPQGTLRVSYSGPDTGDSVEIIPAEVLTHVPEAPALSVASISDHGGAGEVVTLIADDFVDGDLRLHNGYVSGTGEAIDVGGVHLLPGDTLNIWSGAGTGDAYNIYLGLGGPIWDPEGETIYMELDEGDGWFGVLADSYGWAGVSIAGVGAHTYGADLNTEHVVIINRSQHNSWGLSAVDLLNTTTSAKYTFPSFELPARGAVTVRTGAGSDGPATVFAGKGAEWLEDDGQFELQLGQVSFTERRAISLLSE